MQQGPVLLFPPSSYLFRNLKIKENRSHLIAYKNAETVFMSPYRSVNTYKVSASHPESETKGVDCQFAFIKDLAVRLKLKRLLTWD